jgi:divalent metal cation (Fe/Co/Zn/Cd) transporter
MIGFGVVKYNAASLAASSLSKCITFDAFGIASTTIFEVLEHYPVWSNSSIKHPFGLKRAEVVVRFASAVYLTYSGVELIREVVERLVIGGGHGHGPTDEIHIDPHALNSDLMPISMIATIFITIFAAVMFGNHSQLSQVLDLDTFPRILRNPFYLLTILPAGILLGITMLDMHLHGIVDRLIALGISGALMYIGLILTFRLGSILLMTYPSSSVASLFEAVENDDSVAHVEGKVWQVWTGLVVVTLRVSVRGGESAETRVRERIIRYTRDVLGGGYGSGKSIRFEVKVECDRV